MTEATLEKQSIQIVPQLTVENLISSFAALGVSREEVLGRILNAGVDFSSVPVPPEIAGAMAVDYFRSIGSSDRPSAAISLSPRTEEGEEQFAMPDPAKEQKKSKSGRRPRKPNALQVAGLPWQMGKTRSVRPRNTNAGIMADLTETTIEFLAAIDSKQQFGDRILSEIEQKSTLGQIYSDEIAKLFGEPGSRRYKNRLEKLPLVAASIREVAFSQSQVASDEEEIQEEAAVEIAA